MYPSEAVRRLRFNALVVGGKVYTLKGHEAEVDKLAGEKAIVKGDVKGDTIQVQSVSAANK